MRRPILSLLVLAGVVTGPIPARARQAIQYEPVEVARNVYVFQPNDPGVGNVVAVVSQGHALLVDATATPAAAQQVLVGLRRLGVVSVAVVVNTHWHDDHIWGNQVFADSFPDVQILAHPATVDGIRTQALPSLSGQIERLHERIDQRAQLLETGVSSDGSPMGADERRRLEARQALFADAVQSLETVRPTLPRALVAESTSFDIGDLTVVVDHIGAGHTEGDVVVRVPARGVVAVGDLVSLPVPAAAEADIMRWIPTLEALSDSEWTALIPGHGAVQRDREYTNAVLRLFRDLVAYVRQGIRAGASPDDLINSADFGETQDRWLGANDQQDAMFRVFFLDPAIRSTYRALTVR
jgi:glyoxylase-like metal-dependent hydrolase (beta-lactamase superfamily II)